MKSSTLRHFRGASVLVFLLLTLAFSSACGVDDEPFGPLGKIKVTWTLSTFWTCELGDSVMVISLGSAMSFGDIYSCADGGATTAPLPIGDYSVQIALRDEGKTPLTISSLKEVSLTEVGEVVDAGNFFIP